MDKKGSTGGDIKPKGYADAVNLLHSLRTTYDKEALNKLYGLASNASEDITIVTESQNAALYGIILVFIAMRAEKNKWKLSSTNKKRINLQEIYKDVSERLLQDESKVGSELQPLFHDCKIIADDRKNPTYKNTWFPPRTFWGAAWRLTWKSVSWGALAEVIAGGVYVGIKKPDSLSAIVSAITNMITNTPLFLTLSPALIGAVIAAGTVIYRSNIRRDLEDSLYQNRDNLLRANNIKVEDSRASGLTPQSKVFLDSSQDRDAPAVVAAKGRSAAASSAPAVSEDTERGEEIKGDKSDDESEKTDHKRPPISAITRPAATAW